MGFIGLSQVIHPKGGMTGEHHVKAYSDAHTEMTTISKRHIQHTQRSDQNHSDPEHLYAVSLVKDLIDLACNYTDMSLITNNRSLQSV